MALFVAALTQALVIGRWRNAIAKGNAQHAEGKELPPPITAIIPARNEEDAIAGVLQDLHRQAYPKEVLQVLVIDDGSMDRTASVAQGMRAAWPQLDVLSNRGAGKKAAITTGVDAAQHNIIVLTDADTAFGEERLRAIAQTISANRLDMLILPVLTKGDGFLGALQASEQAALLGMALGSALNGAPTMAYGANLAFTRAAFREVGGFGGDRFASGDDLFLLRRMQAHGKRIGALLNREVLVTTDAVGAWGEFFAQRLRWAGKMRGAIGAMSCFGALGLAFPWVLLYFTVRFDLVSSMGQNGFYQLLLLASAWLLWLLPPVSLVRDVQRTIGVQAQPVMNVFALIAFSVYAPLIALLSLVIRPKWKGRKVR
ncbi:MAG TPA: glycosyltransferase [Flavobacteriales bacterium]|nr:glycosyltransferase [Flavobacteriales bacterium]